MYHIALHNRTPRMCYLYNKILQWLQIPFHHPHWPWVYKSTQFNLLNLVYEIVFLGIEKCWSKYFCISHIRRGISLFQYLISSLWISLDESHLQMMQENNGDQQNWGIYNKVPRCKTQYVNNLWNKETKKISFIEIVT